MVMTDDGWIDGFDEDGNLILLLHLTPTGRAHHEAGLKLDWEEGDFDCAIDAQRIALAEF
jgi:hypothetical protein